MMKHRMILLGTALAITACGGGKSADNASNGVPVTTTADSLVVLGEVQELPLTPPPPPAKAPPVNVPKAPPPPPRQTPPPVAVIPTPAPGTPRLESGRSVNTTLVDSVHSRYTKVGDAIKVRVASDVSSNDGKVVIPAGSIISLRVSALAMADSKGEKGTLELTGNSVDLEGISYPIAAAATDYEYEMRARGITSGDVAKTGAGAVAGAIIGRVVAGKKGTIAGALGGGAVGAAVANSTADRDIIVHAGQKMTLTLRGDFVKPQ